MDIVIFSGNLTRQLRGAGFTGRILKIEDLEEEEILFRSGKELMGYRKRKTIRLSM